MKMTQTYAYPLSVDYDRTLAEHIHDGHYDHVNAFLTEPLFPIQGRGQAEVDAALVCLERTASTQEVLAEVEGPELRPGRIAELLTLGAARPDLQRSFPIVALGSVALYPHDYLRIPFLWGSPRVCQLDLRWDEHSWGANIRFLVIRQAA